MHLTNLLLQLLEPYLQARDILNLSYVCKANHQVIMRDRFWKSYVLRRVFKYASKLDKPINWTWAAVHPEIAKQYINLRLIQQRLSYPPQNKEYLRIFIKFVTTGPIHNRDMTGSVIPGTEKTVNYSTVIWPMQNYEISRSNQRVKLHFEENKQALFWVGQNNLHTTVTLYAVDRTAPGNTTIAYQNMDYNFISTSEWAQMKTSFLSKNQKEEAGIIACKDPTAFIDKSGRCYKRDDHSAFRQPGKNTEFGSTISVTHKEIRAHAVLHMDIKLHVNYFIQLFGY